MFEYKINTINHKFEDIKEKLKNGMLPIFASFEIEKLYNELIELKPFINDSQSKQDLEALSIQIKEFYSELGDALSDGCATSL